MTDTRAWLADGVRGVQIPSDDQQDRLRPRHRRLSGPRNEQRDEAIRYGVNHLEAGFVHIVETKLTVGPLGMSKLCNIWLTRELQKRLDRENANILVMCVDPGSVATCESAPLLPPCTTSPADSQH